MRVLLAGGTGVLGRRIIPLLHRAGHEVVGLARSTTSAQALRTMGAEVVSGDALDADETMRAVAEARADVVMHQLTDLSTGDSNLNARLRIIGTRNLAEAAVHCGIGTFIAQSISWAYAPGDEPADETVPLDIDADQPRRSTVVAVASLEEQASRLPEWVVLRNGMLYGSDTWFTVGGAQAARAAAGLIPAGADITSFVHVDDAARAAVAALDWPTGTVNVCDDAPAPATDWVPAFCAAVGAPAPPADHAPRSAFARGAANQQLRDRGFELLHRTWALGFSTLSRE